ncbi:MAG: DUF4097 family beta strand repeat-containing protein [Acidobacteriota bacterium]|nr:DUF4097 family beta strand repeat-containing protein [Acidobacteriota bacterium]
MKKIAFFSLIFLFSLTMAYAAESHETLTLPSAGCSALRIDSGAGDLKVQGKEGLERIEASAILQVRGISESELQQFKKEHVILKLEKIGSKAVLTAKIDEKFSLEKLFGSREAYIDLTVSLPRGMDLDVEDGSGDTTIRSLDGRLDLEDGSGDVTLDEIAGTVKIEDGSGDLFLANLKNSVEIEDGSGDIDLKDAGGDVFIEDGSGEIRVSRIRGSVKIDDGSGDIEIDGVDMDVNIEEAGSGDLEILNVKGKVKK